MTETIATYSVEPSDDRDFTLEEIQAIADTAKTSEPKLTELEQLNLKVAAIACWENIEIWNLKLERKTSVGTNKKFPHLGIFVPDYTRDLNAICAVFRFFDIYYRVSYDSKLPIPASAFGYTAGAKDETEAIALCKLLLELAPNLPKPEPEVQVIDDDGEIDEPVAIAPELTPDVFAVEMAIQLGAGWTIRVEDVPHANSFDITASRLGGTGVGLRFHRGDLFKPIESIKQEIKSRLHELMPQTIDEPTVIEATFG